MDAADKGGRGGGSGGGGRGGAGPAAPSVSDVGEVGEYSAIPFPPGIYRPAGFDKKNPVDNNFFVDKRIEMKPESRWLVKKQSSEFSLATLSYWNSLNLPKYAWKDLLFG